MIPKDFSGLYDGCLIRMGVRMCSVIFWMFLFSCCPVVHIGKITIGFQFLIKKMKWRFLYRCCTPLPFIRRVSMMCWGMYLWSISATGITGSFSLRYIFLTLWRLRLAVRRCGVVSRCMTRVAVPAGCFCQQSRQARSLMFQTDLSVMVRTLI